MPERLPIYDIESELVARLKTDRRLILSAPTGSGKTLAAFLVCIDALVRRARLGLEQVRRLLAGCHEQPALVRPPGDAEGRLARRPEARCGRVGDAPAVHGA